MTGGALLVLALLASGPATALDPTEEAVSSPEEACSRVSAVVTERSDVPDGVIGYCEHISAADIPEGIYVLGLRSTRVCDDICSNLMGWFAVHRSTGQVYDWDVAEWRLGDPVDAER